MTTRLQMNSKVKNWLATKKSEMNTKMSKSKSDGAYLHLDD